MIVQTAVYVSAASSLVYSGYNCSRYYDNGFVVGTIVVHTITIDDRGTLPYLLPPAPSYPAHPDLTHTQNN